MNSFRDADLARLEFAVHHFYEVLVGSRKHNLALGSIACTFKKEIKPFESFVMETRVSSSTFYDTSCSNAM